MSIIYDTIESSDNLLLIIWVVLMPYFCSRQSRFELLVFNTFIKDTDGNLKIITVWSFVEGRVLPQFP